MGLHAEFYDVVGDEAAVFAPGGNYARPGFHSNASRVDVVALVPSAPAPVSAPANKEDDNATTTGSDAEAPEWVEAADGATTAVPSLTLLDDDHQGTQARTDLPHVFTVRVHWSVVDAVRAGTVVMWYRTFDASQFDSDVEPDASWLPVAFAASVLQGCQEDFPTWGACAVQSRRRASSTDGDSGRDRRLYYYYGWGSDSTVIDFSMGTTVYDGYAGGWVTQFRYIKRDPSSLVPTFRPPVPRRLPTHRFPPVFLSLLACLATASSV